MQAGGPGGGTAGAGGAGAPGTDQVIPGLHAVVPAGGAGSRLWPLSRATSPKFLLDLTGSGRSLLQQTWDRLSPLVGRTGITVVTGTAHADAVAAQLPDVDPSRLLAEPSPRDSMAAIGLAAELVARREPDAVVGSFPADHVVRDHELFAETVRQAVVAAGQGWLTTIGVVPHHPATGFGYVRSGARLDLPGAPLVRRGVEFVEKPDAARAEAYLRAGDYRWNAGMFVVRASVLLDALAAHRPSLAAGLARVAQAWDTPDRAAVLHREWPALEAVPIDVAVAEPVAAAGGLAVVPGGFGWDDVGDVAALAGLAGDPADDVRVLGDPADVVSVDATGFVAPAGGRLVALLGVDDIVVLDTPDALLVASRDRAQQVRRVVQAVRDAGRADLL